MVGQNGMELCGKASNYVMLTLDITWDVFGTGTPRPGLILVLNSLGRPLPAHISFPRLVQSAWEWTKTWWGGSILHLLHVAKIPTRF